jgi:ElaB/YqjD/DUF883 family membrane-anchored ribosome-binding protein
LQVVPPKVRDALTPRLASVSPRGVESSNDLKRLLEEAQEVECAGKGEEAQAAKDEVQAAREEAQEALLAAKEEAQAAREEAQAAKKEVLRLMKELETRQGKLAALRGEVGRRTGVGCKNVNPFRMMRRTRRGCTGFAQNQH